MIRPPARSNYFLKKTAFALAHLHEASIVSNESHIGKTVASISIQNVFYPYFVRLSDMMTKITEPRFERLL